eukprot:TRINITY_DN5712_c0_g1_i1.p1 TRINITY_DN5712_c0_g1~~TRINITY_DN5712_c0_g1_i1.p1  ORF type:complete len:430 (+),score=142.95 TRINITY_DN5712_c0_g1_i1:28-1317(+)
MELNLNNMEDDDDLELIEEWDEMTTADNSRDNSPNSSNNSHNPFHSPSTSYTGDFSSNIVSPLGSGSDPRIETVLTALWEQAFSKIDDNTELDSKNDLEDDNIPNPNILLNNESLKREIQRDNNTGFEYKFFEKINNKISDKPQENNSYLNQNNNNQQNNSLFSMIHNDKKIKKEEDNFDNMMNTSIDFNNLGSLSNNNLMISNNNNNYESGFIENNNNNYPMISKNNNNFLNKNNFLNIPNFNYESVLSNIFPNKDISNIKNNHINTNNDINNHTNNTNFNNNNKINNNKNFKIENNNNFPISLESKEDIPVIEEKVKKPSATKKTNTLPKKTKTSATTKKSPPPSKKRVTKKEQKLKVANQVEDLKEKNYRLEEEFLVLLSTNKILKSQLAEMWKLIESNQKLSEEANKDPLLIPYEKFQKKENVMC